MALSAQIGYIDYEIYQEEPGNKTNISYNDGMVWYSRV